ncbi:antitermination protein NusB [Mycobacterium sp. ACS4054]|uniref:antitermination protein NusB n=1 Tax=Mycobacterium sp. ACS4054 TaxID=1834119 RepID=UPI0007FE03A1|nr:antitermination protein NusB [Mycobacterium sp. ACS4054]OBF07578.1 antitermination protein NusB [Mycobacterium sp. ACS4054]
MTRLEARLLVAAILAATVVVGAVVCAAFGLAIVASVLAIFALGVGAWLYHCVERVIMANRISTVRQAAKPLQPLLPVMAALMGLTQSVVRSLSDVTELPARRWELPVLRWVETTRGNRRVVDADEDDDELNS